MLRAPPSGDDDIVPLIRPAVRPPLLLLLPARVAKEEEEDDKFVRCLRAAANRARCVSRSLEKSYGQERKANDGMNVGEIMRGVTDNADTYERYMYMYACMFRHVTYMHDRTRRQSHTQKGKV